MMKRCNLKKKQLMNLSELVGLFIVFEKVSIFIFTPQTYKKRLT